MAAGEAGVVAAELFPPLPPPGGTGTERALEEAAVSGTLSLAGRRLRAFPVAAARRWDLSDTTQADLSRNRFGEVPEAACRLVSLEALSLYHNCLRSISPAIANLQALTHLDLSRNQLSSLPPCLCLLPLRVLNASNNRLAQLPENIGALSGLRQLDVGCNELLVLPAGMGQLKALRDLNLRRNQLRVLPAELSELPLVRLDFSCNRVVTIPRCYRRLRHLQIILADNNPLQSPPAQVCLKGKVHIFKYLHHHAEAAAATRTPPACPTDELCPLRQRGGLDSGFNSVDSGSKRWSGNESTDEFAELPRQHGEKRSGGAGDSDPELFDSVEEGTPLEVTTEPGGSSPGGDTPEKATGGRVVPGAWWGEGRRRPQSLELWREKERRDRTRTGTTVAAPSPPSSPRVAAAPAAATRHSTLPQQQPRVILGAEEPPAPPGAPPRLLGPRRPQTHQLPLPHGLLHPPPPAPPDPDEGELIAEMRQSLESLLQLRLPEALSDQELLHRLAAHLVPSPTAPKLSPANRRRNIESCLQGAPEVKPPTPQNPPPPGVLAGFALFYGLVMMLLYAAYHALFGC
ncbi:leucine-rich repeat and calponin homology domain-containing protein 4 [Falco rusticolus]|uniref:leucine-rich repeat and calponin homology domain-containing protein 4 n=1 Tax=Falco rusticolus TaxID=120794 RepID=UPI0018865742|nr:leucine-rich repeat and calponin homology domain-containing protein 4 [Falco rusticolus]